MNEQTFRRLFHFCKDDLPVLVEALKIQTIGSSQGVTGSGEEALLMGLRRLAYPNRWWDFEHIFGFPSSALSNIVSQLFHYIGSTFGHVLMDVTNHSSLTLSDLEQFSEVSTLFAHLRNCWGFVDATARPICGRTVNQRTYFSGLKGSIL
ncbi:hypothetical protein HPB52_007914 [Rhipicephalus sanguineus]|uniref:Uncharacterized protein n=1 Tax=Rhipicephalus sanguineus TaxID=34632 RepID=A0A9D4T7F4_RHISA|nr:hypothetical protein HPB52_007914 [Rhipicephalus sanguineus]